MSEQVFPYGRESGISVYDGSQWRRVKGDVNGHIQVDAVSTADPPSLDISLSALRDAICGGSNLAKVYNALSSILTELQAKLGTDNLLVEATKQLATGGYVFDGTTWQKVKGDPSGHPQVDIVTLPTLNVGVRVGQIQNVTYNGTPGDTLLHTLKEITTRSRIISLDFVSNHQHSRIRFRGATTLYIGPAAQLPTMCPRVVLSDLFASGSESSFFKIGIYDTTQNYYSFFLKREFETDGTFALDYMAGSTTATLGLTMTWVELS